MIARQTFSAAVGMLAAMLAGCDGMSMGGSIEGGDPGEGNYTIRLHTFVGPNHNERARLYKQRTEEDAHWSRLYIVHGDEESTLYWRRFATLEQAGPYLKRARAYVTPTNLQVYSNAEIVSVPGTEPGPAAWRSDHAEGYWSVLVGLYYADPDADFYARKEAAVEHCKLLREKGEEAYYYHGPSRSLVMIGAFPEQAVQMVRRSREFFEPEVVDLQMREIMLRYPELAVNGHQEIVRSVDRTTGRTVETITVTYPIKIPRNMENP